MSERVFESGSPEETEAIGERLGTLLRAGDLVLLEGELGAGKTCLTRGIARGVGADARAVSSPTYVIAQEYEGRTLTLVHVDAYRLTQDDDLESAGVEADGCALVVEWASRLWDAAPAGALTVNIEHGAEETRRLTLTGDDSWNERLKNV